MRDDRRHGRLGTGIAIAVLLSASAAGAQGIYGSFQTQYQKSDEFVTLVSGNNTTRSYRTSQETWVRALDLHQQSYLRANLILESNFRLSERSVLSTEDFSRTPTGSFRLVHPFMQLSASHQPSWTRTSFLAQQGAAADSNRALTTTTRNRESVYSGHLSFPNLPRVDVAQVVRVRDGGNAMTDRNRTRSARVAWDRERYSAYATVNDQRTSSAAPGALVNQQLVAAAGGAYRLPLGKKASMNAQYDASDVLGKVGDTRRPAQLSQTAILTGDWRPGAKWVGSSSYQWRRLDSGSRVVPATTDQEGSLTGRYLLSRRSSVLTGAGFRTARDLTTASPREGFQKYAMALAAIDAPIRRRLGLNSSLSHTTNWDLGRSPYSIETVSGTARGRVARGLDADFNMQFAMTGDSAVAAAKYSASWAARVQARPLRSLQCIVSLRNLRSGPGLLEPVSVVRGLQTEANWRPVQSMQLIAQLGWDETSPAATARSTTRSITARYEPSRKWQWYGSWTRNDQRVFVSTAGQLSSRETVTGRLQFAPSRRIAVHGSLSYNDPGREQESRRADLTFAWSFGR